LESALKLFITSSLSLLIAVAFLLTPTLVDGKTRVKKTVKLAEGADLVLSVDDEIGSCWKERPQSKRVWVCMVTLKKPGEKQASLRLKVHHSGSWQAFAAEEDEDEDAKGDDDDSVGDDDDSAGDDDDSADWQNKPILTEEDRLDKIVEKQDGKFTVLKAEGEVAGEAGARTLTIPADLLPEGTFLLGTNGYFGMNYAGVKIGSGSKSGVIKVKR